jgi:hypothetical protein
VKDKGRPRNKGVYKDRGRQPEKENRRPKEKEEEKKKRKETKKRNKKKKKKKKKQQKKKKKKKWKKKRKKRKTLPSVEAEMDAKWNKAPPVLDSLRYPRRLTQPPQV